mmetsp:Transcript_10519/g.28132  ORF Transcript_10519/g.28132 Transcript_10519/m.28132 type:complete len:113 (+) Transcript_10519:333-671(+)
MHGEKLDCPHDRRRPMQQVAGTATMAQNTKRTLRAHLQPLRATTPCRQQNTRLTSSRIESMLACLNSKQTLAYVGTPGPDRPSRCPDHAWSAPPRAYQRSLPAMPYFSSSDW